MVLSAWAAVPATAADEPSPTTPVVAPSEPVAEPTVEPGEDVGEVTDPDPEAPESTDPRVLVFGDSISATKRYSAEGSVERPKAWWAHVAEAAGVQATDVMISAEGGSGLLMRGMGTASRICTGSTFGERLADLEVARPDVVLVAVGRNDIRACTGTTPRPSTETERRAAAESYFTALAQATDRQGVARSSVYVLTAWGSAFGTGQVDTTTMYEAAATRRGFTWIPVPALVREQTVDATHPNEAGAKAIADAVLRSSDVALAIRSRGRLHTAVPSSATVLCTGVSVCRTRGTTTGRYARHRVWGLAPGTPTHFVADRLTSRHLVAPVLGVRSARQWRDAARTQGAAQAVAHARVGDVAWWHTAPSGTGATSGHVAVVQRVATDNSWVVVAERTVRGTLRSVRYSGASLPRGYLRFARTKGGPRGIVTDLRARRGSVAVTGRVVDTDAVRRGVKVRIVVRQAGRTWTRTTVRPVGSSFSRRLPVPGLRRGKATVRVVALDVPGTRGTHRLLATQRLVVR